MFLEKTESFMMFFLLYGNRMGQTWPNDGGFCGNFTDIFSEKDEATVRLQGTRRLCSILGQWLHRLVVSGSAAATEIEGLEVEGLGSSVANFFGWGCFEQMVVDCDGQ